MPTSIIIAVISLSILMALRLIFSFLSVISGTASILYIISPIVISALILVGIIKGHKLAWQWGRILGIIGAVLLTWVTILVFASEDPLSRKVFEGTILLIEAISLYVVFFAIGTKEAKKYFRLICPQCGAGTSTAGDFLFTKAVCKKCNHKW